MAVSQYVFIAFVLSFVALVIAMPIYLTIEGMITNAKRKQWLAQIDDQYYVPTLRSNVVSMPSTKPSSLSIAKRGLASANKGNPFWSKSDAMRSINVCRVVPC